MLLFGWLTKKKKPVVKEEPVEVEPVPAEAPEVEETPLVEEAPKPEPEPEPESEPEPEPEPKAEKSLAGLTVKELKEMAKDKGVKGYSAMKKADLLEALK